MAVTEPTITPRKTKTTTNCVRCRLQGQTNEAEWNVAAPDEKSVPMCDAHARYWAAMHGIMTFPGDAPAP